MPDPQNPVVSLLLRSPLSPAQRRAASEAFSSSSNEDELADKLVALKLPAHVSADLWDLKASQPPMPASDAPAEPQGSAVQRFGAGLMQTANPVAIAEGLYNTFRHPIDTATGIYDASAEQVRKGTDELQAGNYGQAAARYAAAMPIIGPQAAAIGEQIGSGDYAGGAGALVGMAIPYGVSKVMGAKAGNVSKVDRLEREAIDQASRQALAPANPRYRLQAPKVAEALLQRGVQGDRIALQQYADNLIGDAAVKIDQAWDALPEDFRSPTKPILQRIDAELADMEFSGKPKLTQVETGVVDPQGKPVMRTKSVPTREVNPVMADRHAELSRLRQFIADRGDELTKDDVRQLRQQFDDASVERGALSKSSGDAKVSDSGKASLSAANALRQQIAQDVPELAPANADMHLGLTLRDILDPAKGRPSTPSVTTGATGGLHTTAAVIGSGLSKTPGLQGLAAFVASKVIPAIREAEISPANQLRLAHDKWKLAQALKEGKPTRALQVVRQMSFYVPALDQVGRITEPSAGVPQ